MQNEPTFVAIEVATGDTLRHIVGIAVTEFREGEIEGLDGWQTRLDPDTEFSRALRLIDAVTGQELRRFSNFPAVHPILREWLTDKVVVAHGDHARRALEGACDRYGLARFNCRWLDSHALARSCLQRRREDQYRLESLGAWLGREVPRGELDVRAQVVGLATLWCAALLGARVTDLPDSPLFAEAAAQPAPGDDELDRPQRSCPDSPPKTQLAGAGRECVSFN
jgi:hypothetical protein